MISKNTFVWENNFPPVCGHTSVSFLKHCQGFEDAKKGDMFAAKNVVNMCVKLKLINEIKRKYPESVVLPVISDNKLPEALAGKIGMKMNTGVYRTDLQSRKNLSAIERLLQIPCFEGKIKKGERYIIVDDIITQGGTVSALRKYVISRGGSVAAIAVLAFAADSQIIVPDSEDVSALINKYSSEFITEVLKQYNIANNIRELTRAQIRYLLRFGKPSNLTEMLKRNCDFSDH